MIVSYGGLRAMNRVNALAVDESTAALRGLGEAAIQQKALSVARQVDLYLEAHPGLLRCSRKELEDEEALAAIAVQLVGETGYTALYDAGGVTHFHANPEIVGLDMATLADALPEFWAIFEPSLDGSVSAGYYDWQNGDGVIREKYMSCVPVGDTSLRIAATTYIDEFYQPMRVAEAKITAIFQETRRYLLAALVFVGLLSVGLALSLAWSISRPVHHLALAAERLEQGAYRSRDLEAATSRRDDLGHLACVFDRMAREVAARESRLHHQIKQLRIQIDENKRERYVAQVTETEYFQRLREQAQEMREGARRENG